MVENSKHVEDLLGADGENRSQSLVILDRPGCKRGRVGDSCSSAFPVGSDGRLVITDNEEQQQTKKLAEAFGVTKKHNEGPNPFAPSASTVRFCAGNILILASLYGFIFC